MKEESNDDNKAKVFDFLIESQKSEAKLGKKGCKKGEKVTKVWQKEKRKKWKKLEGSWGQRKKIWHKYLKRTETKAGVATHKT